MRDQEIWQLRAQGRSVAEIAEAASLSQAQVRTSLQHVAEEYKVEAAAEIIKMELDRLDIMLLNAMEVLNTRHVAYSNGRKMVDTDAEGNETSVIDDTPVLQAIDRVLKIMDRRSKYLGLDAPSKSEQSINVHSTTETDLALQTLIDTYKQNALALTPEDLQLPQHPTFTLPADHFTETQTHDHA